MPDAMNPDTLKSLRVERQLTQEALALRCGCTKDTVSRWERGRSGNLRPRLREKLSQVLGVKWEVLTRPLEKPQRPAEREDLVQISARVRPEVRNALQLVCVRYRVEQRMIFEYAPLLFLLAAEESFRARSAAVDELDQGLWAASDKVHRLAPYLGRHYPDSATQSAIIEEHRAIEGRDLFRTLCEALDDDDHNPFVFFLAGRTAGLPEGAVQYCYQTYAGYARYRIALDTLDELLKPQLLPTAKADQVRMMILEGELELRTVVAQRATLSEPDFEKWIDERLEERAVEDRRFFQELTDAVELGQIDRDALAEALTENSGGS